MVVYLAGPTDFRSKNSIRKQFIGQRVRKVDVYSLNLSGRPNTYIRMTFDNPQNISNYLSRELDCDVTCLVDEEYWVAKQIIDDVDFPQWGRKWLNELGCFTFQCKFCLSSLTNN